jgi:hypothetical protein
MANKAVPPAIPTSVVQTTPMAPSAEILLSASPRFGMPHALVIIGFITAASVLGALGMNVQDILLLLGGAGGVSVTVVLAASLGKPRSSGLLRRVITAALNQGK